MLSRTCRTALSLTTLALTAACFAPTDEVGDVTDGWRADEDPAADRERPDERAAIFVADDRTSEHAPPAANELCDGNDNNGDGVVDEGFDVGGECAIPGELGVCGVGEIMCTPIGEATCVGTQLASQETCDGLDNDCDGLVDGADEDAPWPGDDDYEYGATFLGDPEAKRFASLSELSYAGSTWFGDPDDADFYLVYRDLEADPAEMRPVYCRIQGAPNLRVDLSLGSRQAGEPELPHLSDSTTCHDLAPGEVCALHSNGNVAQLAIAITPRVVDACNAGYELECVEKIPAHW